MSIFSTVRCPDCGTNSNPGAARFCGRCGQLLTEPSATRHGGRRRSLVWAALVLAAMTAAGSVAHVSLTTSARPSEVATGEVELPGQDTLPPRTTDPAVADPTPLRCEPVGCERWRRTLPTDSSAIGAARGSVVVLLDDVLSAIDGGTGEIRWTARLDGDTNGDPSEARFESPIAIVTNSDLVVAANPLGRVEAREIDDGSLRWSTSLDPPNSSVRFAGDDVVLLSFSVLSQDGFSHRLRALAADDGRLLWSRAIDGTLDVGAQRVLLRYRGRTRALDVSTGEGVFDADGLASHIGPWIAVDDGLHTHLLHPDDGTPQRVLQGTVKVRPVRAGDTWVTVVAQPVRPGASDYRTTVVGLDDSDELRWSRDLDINAATCCVLVESAPGRILVQAAGGAGAVVLAGTTGSVVDRPAPLALDELGTAASSRIWLSHQGETLTLHASTGSARVTGTPELVGHQPPVVSDGRELVGLRLLGGSDSPPFDDNRP